MEYHQLVRKFERATVSKAQLEFASVERKTPIHAIAELVDNSKDANAKSVDIEILIHEGKPILVVKDNGKGISREHMIQNATFGFTTRSKDSTTTIGRYGNGMKAGSFKIGRELLVLTKFEAEKLEPVYTAYLISNKLLETFDIQDRIVISIPSFDAEFRPITDDLPRHNAQVEAIERFGPLSGKSLQTALQEIKGCSGTIVIVGDLRTNENGQLVVDLGEQYDIRLRSAEFGSEEREISLRSHLESLYSEPRMKICLRGKEVIQKLLTRSWFFPHTKTVDDTQLKGIFTEKLKALEAAVVICHDDFSEKNNAHQQLINSFGIDKESRREMHQAGMALELARNLLKDAETKLEDAKKAKGPKKTKIKFFFGINVKHRNNSGFFIYLNDRLVVAGYKNASIFKNREHIGLSCVIHLTYESLAPTCDKQSLECESDLNLLVRIGSGLLKQYMAVAKSKLIPDFLEGPMVDFDPDNIVKEFWLWLGFADPFNPACLRGTLSEVQLREILEACPYIRQCSNCRQWRAVKHCDAAPSYNHKCTPRCPSTSDNWRFKNLDDYGSVKVALNSGPSRIQTEKAQKALQKKLEDQKRLRKEQDEVRRQEEEKKHRRQEERLLSADQRKEQVERRRRQEEEDQQREIREAEEHRQRVRRYAEERRQREEEERQRDSSGDDDSDDDFDPQQESVLMKLIRENSQQRERNGDDRPTTTMPRSTRKTQVQRRQRSDGQSTSSFTKPQNRHGQGSSSDLPSPPIPNSRCTLSDEERQFRRAIAAAEAFFEQLPNMKTNLVVNNSLLTTQARFEDLFKQLKLQTAELAQQEVDNGGYDGEVEEVEYEQPDDEHEYEMQNETAQAVGEPVQIQRPRLDAASVRIPTNEAEFQEDFHRQFRMLGMSLRMAHGSGNTAPGNSLVTQRASANEPILDVVVDPRVEEDVADGEHLDETDQNLNGIPIQPRTVSGSPNGYQPPENLVRGELAEEEIEDNHGDHVEDVPMEVEVEREREVAQIVPEIREEVEDGEEEEVEGEDEYEEYDVTERQNVVAAPPARPGRGKVLAVITLSDSEDEAEKVVERRPDNVNQWMKQEPVEEEEDEVQTLEVQEQVQEVQAPVERIPAVRDVSPGHGPGTTPQYAPIPFMYQPPQLLFNGVFGSANRMTAANQNGQWGSSMPFQSFQAPMFQPPRPHLVPGFGFPNGTPPFQNLPSGSGWAPQTGQQPSMFQPRQGTGIGSSYPGQNQSGHSHPAEFGGSALNGGNRFAVQPQPGADRRRADGNLIAQMLGEPHNERMRTIQADMEERRRQAQEKADRRRQQESFGNGGWGSGGDVQRGQSTSAVVPQFEQDVMGGHSHRAEIGGQIRNGANGFGSGAQTGNGVQTQMPMRTPDEAMRDFDNRTIAEMEERQRKRREKEEQERRAAADGSNNGDALYERIRKFHERQEERKRKEQEKADRRRWRSGDGVQHRGESSSAVVPQMHFEPDVMGAPRLGSANRAANRPGESSNGVARHGLSAQEMEERRRRRENTRNRFRNRSNAAVEVIDVDDSDEEQGGGAVNGDPKQEETE